MSILTGRDRRQIWRNNLLGALRLGGRRLVRVDAVDGLFRVRDGGGTIWVPAAGRALHYRRGIGARIARVARQYGAGPEYPPPSGGTVIDIGANVGEFALALAPHAERVIAIEPDPACFACLQRNTRDTANIVPVRTLLWFAEAELEFHSAPAHADSSVFSPDSGEAGPVLRLPARPLDAVCAGLGVGDVALIKCDAEGAEPEVLRGADAVLARTRLVAIDTGPERDGARTHDACAAILGAAGFAVADTYPDGRHMTIGRRDGAA